MKLELSLGDDEELQRWIRQLVATHIERISRDDLNLIINKMLDNKIKEVEKRVYDSMMSEVNRIVNSNFIQKEARDNIVKTVTEALSKVLVIPK